MAYTVFFGNIGYARDIDGSLKQHLRRLHRHFYCPLTVQQQVLMQLRSIIYEHKPELCCFVEIDEGSFFSQNFNQMKAMIDENYIFNDMADKYGPGSKISRLPFHRGKSNGFMAQHSHPYEKMYFSRGSKRLIYRLVLPDQTHLYFTHFSLIKSVRAQQFVEIHDLIKQSENPAILLGDFNIMHGFSELAPLLDGTGMHLLNDDKTATFKFHRRSLILDLCVCSDSIRDRLDLKIIPQPYSDHAALLVTIN